ncbi:MAG: MarR family winged helix-turn-helix transcriptional regulator [Rhizobiaceae bacterium]
MAKKDRKILQQVQVVARLGRTALAMRLLEKKLYAGQDQLMLSLALLDGQTPGQLAIELGVRPPTITKTISRLQAQGFLDKRGSDSDARQAHIFLTDAGREAILSIEKSIKKTEKKALDGLDKKDRKTLSKLLKKVESNLSSGKSDEADKDDDTDLDDDAVPVSDAKDQRSAA